MRVVLHITLIVLIVSAAVLGHCPACDDDFTGFGNNPGKCGCCPPPCCCKCVETVCDTVTTQIPCGCLDVVFLMDGSGSIGKLAWTISKQFLIDIVLTLENHNQECDHEVAVAVITFGNNSTLHFNLFDPQNADLDTLLSAIADIPQCRGRTNLAESVEVAISEVFNQDREECPDMAIIITDGKTDIEADLLPEKAEGLKNVTDQIFCIGITTKIDLFQLHLFCPEVLDINDFPLLNHTAVEFLQPIMLPTVGPCEKEECFCCCSPQDVWGKTTAPPP